MGNKTIKNAKHKIISSILALSLVAGNIGGLPFKSHADSSSSSVIISKPENVFLENSDPTQKIMDFDSNWKFKLGDQSGAEKDNFDDSSWRNIELPHDYSLEGEYTSRGEAESGYKLGGVAWYRKSFSIPATNKDKKYTIYFDGVYMTSTVYINGHKLGFHAYGYTPFAYDITPYLNFGGNNVISVRTDNPVPSSRWYSGSGIYRDVSLIVSENLHIDLYGVDIKTPTLNARNTNTVTMNVKTKVKNDSDKKRTFLIKHRVYSKEDESEVASYTSQNISLDPGKTTENKADFQANNPKLWDVDDPNLYVVETKIEEDGQVIDEDKTDYGFRFIEANNKDGFLLNGKKIKIKGVCMHHDQGSLGARAYESAIDRQVRILKDMGTNTIRVTHNPASRALINAANKYGMLLIDEAFDGWILPKNSNSNDFSTYFEKEVGESELINSTRDMTWAEFAIKQMVSRGKNDPSIVMWSMGNEVLEGTNWSRQGEYPGVMRNLIKWIQEIDDTRYVTMGDNQLKGGYNNNVVAMAQAISDAGGIVGVNYVNDNRYDQLKNDHPDWTLFGSETASSINSRGIYYRTNGGSQTIDKNLTSYDNSRVNWGALASKAWYDTITRDHVLGEAVWTGFDYLGEPTPWNGTIPGAQGIWPSPKASYFGIIDTAGLEKDSYYLYRSVWNDKDTTLHLLPAWGRDIVSNGAGGVPIVVYTNADSVELFFTPRGGQRRSLGKKKLITNTTKSGFRYKTVEGESGNESLYVKYNLKYEDGKIEAVAYDKNGKEIKNTVGRNFVETTGKAEYIEASLDKKSLDNDGKDLAYVRIDIKDKNGNIVTNANNNIKVDVTGNGSLIAMDNGLQADHQAYDEGNRNAHAGSLIAIVKAGKSSGDININITSEGLKAKALSLKTNKVHDFDAEAGVSYYTYSKTYTVKKSSRINLPQSIKATFSDRSTRDVKVSWEAFDNSLLDKEGKFEIKGKTELGHEVSVNVNVVDDVVALLNVSVNTLPNVIPSLPSQRPGVKSNGDIIDTNFNVKWDAISAEEVKEEKIIQKHGKANIFGKVVDVIANIRIASPKVSLGDNVISQAMNKSTSVDENLLEGSIDNLLDGKKEYNRRNTKNSVFSNIYAAREGLDEFDLVFEYATQQVFGQAGLTFAIDGRGSEYPDKDRIKLLVSETGAEDSWREVNYDLEVSDLGKNVKDYKLNFNPSQATFAKIIIKNKQDKHTCLTEASLNLSESENVIFDSTDFDSLKISNKNLSEEELKKDSYTTNDLKAKIDVKTKENASYTVLPEKDSKINILLESENGLKRRKFTINLVKKAKVDTENLKSMIDYFKSLDEQMYTEESYKKMADKVSEAEKVLGSADINQTKVDALYEEILNLSFELEDKELDEENADTTALIHLFYKAVAIDQSRYTNESFENLKKSLAKAREILDKDKIDQNSCDKAYENLLAAVVGLKLKENENNINKQKLKDLVENIANNQDILEKSDKTKELKGLVEQARKVLDDKNSKAKQVEESYNKLIDVLFKLQNENDLTLLKTSLNLIVSSEEKDEEIKEKVDKVLDDEKTNKIEINQTLNDYVTYKK